MPDRKRPDSSDFGNLSTEVPKDATWKAASESARTPIALEETQIVAGGVAASSKVIIDDNELLQSGEVIGRYRIQDILGSGGMGVVYAAFDPDLDRNVAIKIIRPQADDADAELARSRCLREAKLMAQISHPNVLTVYEVGTIDQQVFIAMEFVNGMTLRDWQKQGRSWSEIIEVYEKAGRGLAAAHAVGLLHRDFKPENVMVDEAGRVRVLDFGMAVASNSLLSAMAEIEESSRSLISKKKPLFSGSLTETGAVMGTPGYMSPEQHMSQEIDARSDQFSFCVALFEALYGIRPFAGDNYIQLAHNVIQGELAEIPKDTEVPRWVQEIVSKGLQRKPSDRFESLEPLLSALGRSRATRPIFYLLGGLGLALALAIAFFFAGVFEAGHADHSDTRCKGGQARLTGVWDANTKSAAAASFSALKSGFSEGSWKATERVLDKYASDWVSMHQKACEATTVRGEQSEQLLDLRMICLDHRLIELNELSSVLTKVDVNLANNAQSAADALSPIADCGDVERLTARVQAPKDEAQWAAAKELRSSLARVKILTDTGQYPEALSLVKTLDEAVKAVAYKPLEAEYYFALGVAQWKTGDSVQAAESLRLAGQIAQAARDDRLKLKAWIQLVHIVGFDLGDLKGALVWSQLAEGALSAGEGDDRLRAQLYNYMGAAYFQAGDYQKSVEFNKKSYDVRILFLPEEHPAVATSLDYLGSGYLMQGESDLAFSSLTRAMEIRQATLGNDHPMVAESHNNLGNAYYHLGQIEQAKQEYTFALETWQAALGPDHPKVAVALANLANVMVTEGDYEQAIEFLKRSLAIEKKSFGENHLNVSDAYYDIGVVYSMMDDDDQALSFYESALESADRGGAREHPNTARVLLALGTTASALGKQALALESVERALTLRTTTNQPVADIAESRFALAKIVFDGKDKELAIELAERAGREYAGLGESYGEAKQEVDSWLQQHR